MFGRNKEAALAAVVASAETRDYVGSDGMSKPHTSLRDKTAVETARAAGVTDAEILAAVTRNR
jgi:hypothetical protein